MNKRFLSIVIAMLCLCFTLTACASNEEPAQSAADTATESQSESATSDAEEASQPEGDNADQSQTAEPATGTYSDGSTPQFSGVKLKLTVNGSEEVVIAMYDNTAVDAFLERLPLTDLSFYDLSGIEKPAETPDEPYSIGDENPGYDPITGEMVIYRPWGNFTIFYGDFRHSNELVPLGIVESGLDVISGQSEDFTGVLERME